jgi:hypothetical protein
VDTASSMDGLRIAELLREKMLSGGVFIIKGLARVCGVCNVSTGSLLAGHLGFEWTPPPAWTDCALLNC